MRSGLCLPIKNKKERTNMRKALLLGIAVCLSFGLFLNAGCAKKSASSGEAIQNSQSLKTTQEKVNYLVGQAQAFMDSKEYREAIDTAQYVLNNLDKNSQQAKDLIEKAKTQLQAVAQKAIEDAKKNLLGK
jgi:ABC-type transporter Mla subunit MlaD